MTLKTWLWTFFIVTVFGWSIFFYVHFFYYARVMNLGFFVPVLAVQLYMGIVAMLRKKKVFLYTGFLLMIAAAVYFFVTVPEYTYKEAQQFVMDKYSTNGVKLVSLDHKTIPTDHSSWFLPDKMYYVAVEVKKYDGETDYYSVDTVQGRAVKLEGPYW